MSVPHVELISAFQYFEGKHIRQLFLYHDIRVPFNNPIPILREALLEHICVASCEPLMYAFRTRTRPKLSAKVRLIQSRIDITLKYPLPQHRMAEKLVLSIETKDEEVKSDTLHEPTPERVEGGQYKYLDIADPELKKNIINEWQNNMTTDAQRRLVCAVCARRTNASEISCLSATVLPLQLLRNDKLPEKVVPTTYNFAAYHRALLHPSGLFDRERLGAVQICKQCEKVCVRRTLYLNLHWQIGCTMATTSCQRKLRRHLTPPLNSI